MTPSAAALLSSTGSPLGLRGVSRRQWLHQVTAGVGTLGLVPLLASAESTTTPGLPLRVPRVKRVIHLFMNGGPFQADLFDPKPRINEFAGQRPAEVQLRTENATGGLMPVPYKYGKHGASGLEISELQIGRAHV